jgi:hypothetical protein
VLGKILTIDNLRKMNFIVINRCCLCKADGETINHLFLHCEFVCLFGMLFSVGLASHGSCQVRWRGCCLLVVGRPVSECCCLENGSSMCCVVFMVGKKQEKL